MPQGEVVQKIPDKQVLYLGGYGHRPFRQSEGIGHRRYGVIEIAPCRRQGEDVAQRLDADFFLLTSEISCLVDALVNALGGEAKQ